LDANLFSSSCQEMICGFCNSAQISLYRFTRSESTSPRISRITAGEAIRPKAGEIISTTGRRGVGISTANNGPTTCRSSVCSVKSSLIMTG
jgi:hypothetical protein